MHRPRIFVVDEPMVGLDPSSARKVCTLFRERGRAGHHRIAFDPYFIGRRKSLRPIAILIRANWSRLAGSQS